MAATPNVADPHTIPPHQGFTFLATGYFMMTPRDKPVKAEEIKSSIRRRGRKISK